MQRASEPRFVLISIAMARIDAPWGTLGYSRQDCLTPRRAVTTVIHRLGRALPAGPESFIILVGERDGSRLPKGTSRRLTRGWFAALVSSKTRRGGCGGACSGSIRSIPSDTSELLDEYEKKEKCGLFGIWGTSEASNIIYQGLFAQQHRGQESAGIAVTDRQPRHFTGIWGWGWSARFLMRGC